MLVFHCVSERAFLILFEHDDLKKRVSDGFGHMELETDVVDVAILRVEGKLVRRNIGN